MKRSFVHGFRMLGAPSLSVSPTVRGRSSSTVVQLLTAEELAALKPLSARNKIVRVPSQDEGTVRLLDVFVVRDGDDGVAAFENHCPHAGGPLNMLPDRFFARSGQHLMCTRHGALFDPADGKCVRGPCADMQLNTLPIREEDGVLVSWEALQQLCANGGGAYVECSADDVRAAGPTVRDADDRPPPVRRAARPKSTDDRAKC